MIFPMFPEKVSKVLNDVATLLPKHLENGKDIINSTSLGPEIRNDISMGRDSAKGEIPVNPTDNTSNNVKDDKDIGVASRTSTPDAMGDFCIGKRRRGTRSVIPPKRFLDYFSKGRKSLKKG